MAEGRAPSSGHCQAPRLWSQWLDSHLTALKGRHEQISLFIITGNLNAANICKNVELHFLIPFQ